MLPPTLGAVKPGDRIALQVIYCPSGFRLLGRRSVGHSYAKDTSGFYPAFPPMLSNRLDFAVDPGMLAQPVVGP